MTKREIYEAAYHVLDQRRQEALMDAKHRRDLALEKIPQILDLEDQMAQSTIKLTKLVLSHSADISEIMPKIVNENLAVQEKIADLLQAHQLPRDFLKTKFHCENCRDTGSAQGERCQCFNTLVRQIAAEDFNRSTHMTLCHFDDFKLGYYQGEDLETMSKIFDFCKLYAAGFSLRSPSILMFGRTGLGKTHLSLAIAHEAIQKGYTALYGTAQDFFSKIQDERFGKGEEGANTTETILETDLFVLDDLGAEYESAFYTSIFYHLINARLNAGKPTIINTNLLPKQIENRYGERVSSRLMTLYKCLKFCGTDIRQQKLWK